jgi:hypothetical protein
MKIKKVLKKGMDAAWKWAKKTLQYARINDENNLLSLTNLAMVIVLWKVWQTDTTTFKDITALFIALFSYQAKRAIEKKKK